MAALLTIDEALGHLKYPSAASLSPADVADLQRKLDTAHELVLDYVAQRLGDAGPAWRAEVFAWTSATAPKRVLAAILEVTAELDAYRGDVDTPSSRPPGYMTPGMVALLHRLRDPGVAV